MSRARLPRGARAACAILALAAGCRMPSDIAATVDGRPVTAAELEAAVQTYTAGFGRPTPALERELPRIRRAVLERLVDRELMLGEAGRRGLRPDQAEVERELAAAGGKLPGEELEATLSRAGSDRGRWRRSIEQDLVIRMLQEQLTAAEAVTDREVAERLARPRDTGAPAEEVRASQILLRDEAAARAARRRIQGGETFADVARQLSLSPDAARGGDLGYFARGQMPPEFEAVAFALAAGQLSDVVETPYGYHLFLVTGRREARARDDAEGRAAARAVLLAERRDTALRAWLVGARRGAKIRYNRSLVPE